MVQLGSTYVREIVKWYPRLGRAHIRFYSYVQSPYAERGHNIKLQITLFSVNCSLYVSQVLTNHVIEGKAVTSLSSLMS